MVRRLQPLDEGRQDGEDGREGGAVFVGEGGGDPLQGGCIRLRAIGRRQHDDHAKQRPRLGQRGHREGKVGKGGQEGQNAEALPRPKPDGKRLEIVAGQQPNKAVGETKAGVGLFGGRVAPDQLQRGVGQQTGQHRIGEDRPELHRRGCPVISKRLHLPLAGRIRPASLFRPSLLYRKRGAV